jgi:hypothetical protein
MNAKTKLLFRMRRAARSAAFYRLRGDIRGAQIQDDYVERLYREAKSHRWREDPFVLAEERGRQEGSRLYDRSLRKNKGERTIGSYDRSVHSRFAIRAREREREGRDRRRSRRRRRR